MPLTTPPPPHPVEIFSRAGITLYWGDSVTALPLLDFTADLIVTDPPYGVGWQSGFRVKQDPFRKIEGDSSQDCALEVLKAALKRLRPYRHSYVFGKFDLQPLGLVSPVELIWDKSPLMGLGDLSLPWGSQHENIQFAVYSPNHKGLSVKRGGLTARMRKGSVIRCPRDNGTGVKNHPTRKPPQLLRELIESSSCFGELVLDPFAGSGSTLEAAYLEGRRAIGIEIDLEYCDVADRRLSALIPPGTPAPERRS